ncbi:hypothetical protein LA277_004619 [Vibrio parahaemolyticus]|nr:hypothetical protein [Vibrio parahaemolyticus]
MLDSISKVYFYELDAREHIFNRLQLNFALYASVLAVIAYMTRMIDYGGSESIITLFFVGILFSLCFLVRSAYFTYNSLTGMQYRLLPDPQELYKYRKEVSKHAKQLAEYNLKYGCNVPVPDVDEVCEDFLVKMMTKCSSFNANVNESRKLGIRRSLLFLVASSAPLVLSSVLFIGFDLDASSPRKDLLIRNSELSSQLSELSEKLLVKQSANSSESNYIYPKVIIMCKSEKKETPPPPPPPVEPTWQVANESYSPPKKSDTSQDPKPKE